MADNFKFVQAQPFILYGAGAITGATSIVLKSFTQINGTLLTMTDFGTVGFGTLEPGNGTLEEQISFTGVTQNVNGTATLTGVSSVLNVSPYTQTSGLAQTHAGSTSFVISNTAGFYDKLTSKNDDETILGLWDFPSGANNPTIGNVTYVAPTTDTQIATKKYVDDVSVAGGTNATTTTQGLVQLPTQAQVDAGTAIGSTGASLTPTPALLRSKLLSDYVADTGAADAYVITPSPAIAAYTVGQRFSFKLSATNTSATPTLNVNGKGAKTIVKRGGSAMIAGDLLIGQVIEVEYDGTNFQLMSPVATAPLTAAQEKFGGTGSDGALNTSGGIINIDLGNAAIVVKNYTSINIATNNLTFTNPGTNGTVIVLKSQGSVVISATIVASGLGGAGGAGGALTVAGATGSYGTGTVACRAGAGGGYDTQTTSLGGVSPIGMPNIYSKHVYVTTGGGGGGGAGSGDGAGGNGSAGGGGVYIECGGALNFSGTITVAGVAGISGLTHGGGGGGGGGGTIAIVYNTLTANSGTLTVTAGAGGAAGSSTNNYGSGGGGGAGAGADGAIGTAGNVSGPIQGAGGAGGVGISYVVPNTEFL